MFEFPRCTILKDTFVYYTADAYPVKQIFTWEELEILKYLRVENHEAQTTTENITRSR